MDERSGTVRLVESHSDGEGRTLTATIARGDVEEALRSDEPVDLLLDVERIAADGHGRERGRIALGWEPEDLERLLGQAGGGEIRLTFDEGELQRLLDTDVEAHGMREKLAVLTVVAGVAAAGASSAAGSVYIGSEGGGSTAAPAAVTHVTASEISSGLTGTQEVTASEVSAGVGVGAPSVSHPGRPAGPSEISTGITGTSPVPPSEISTGIVQEPSPSPEVTTGIVPEPTSAPASASPSSWSSSPEALALAAGTILALIAVGFAARQQRRRPAIT
jgi:hypothetical protein